MTTLREAYFTFIGDTKQGALLTFGRTRGPLEITETLQLAGSYMHFTVKDSNWRHTGNDSNAVSDFGSGFLELYLESQQLPQKQIFPISWATYYTNGSVKEVIARIDPLPVTYIQYYNP